MVKIKTYSGFLFKISKPAGKRKAGGILLILFALLFPVFLIHTREYPKPIGHVYPFWGTSLALSLDEYGREPETGYGIYGGLGHSNLVVRNTYLQFSCGYEFINMGLSLNSFSNRFFLDLAAGYQFHWQDSFTATPLAGGGMLFRLTDNQQVPVAFFQLGGLFDLHLVEAYHLFGAFSYQIPAVRDESGIFKLAIGLRNQFLIIPRIPAENSLSLAIVPDYFSPDGDGYQDFTELRIGITGKNKVKTWSLIISDPAAEPFIIFTGQGKPPGVITWDGNSSNGIPVSPGIVYPVILEVTDELGRRSETWGFIRTNLPVVEPDEISKASPAGTPTVSPIPTALPLPATPLLPKQSTAALRIIPRYFSPDGDGVNETVTVSIKIQGSNILKNWKLNIFDPYQRPFASFAWQDAPPERIFWDGLSQKGELVASAMEYPVYLEITDEYGRISRAQAVIETDVLVIKTGDRYKVQISDIIFAPSTAELVIAEDSAQTSKNLRILQRLKEIFSKFPEYRIHIEGHANNLSWDNPAARAIEEETILKELSAERARTVKAALVELGIEAGRITTEGLGGARPLVPFSDLENRWKNRRVELILIRK